MLNLSMRLESMVFARIRAITADDRARIDAGKHARFGGSKVAVADEQYGVASGGAFNSNDGARVAFGITKADIATLRRDLREQLGIRLSPEQVDALLFEARTTAPGDHVKDYEQRKAYEREKKARRREWARENGFCIICCKNAASYRGDGSQNATCTQCRANVTNTRRKARKPARRKP